MVENEEFVPEKIKEIPDAVITTKSKSTPVKTGYYENHSSPIASTPLKRQRTQSKNTKSSKSKVRKTNQLSSSNEHIQRNVSRSERKEIFSPRKLLEEFLTKVDSSDNDKEEDLEIENKAKNRHEKKEDDLNSKSIELEQQNSQNLDEEIFSPTLKPIRGVLSTKIPQQSSETVACDDSKVEVNEQSSINDTVPSQLKEDAENNENDTSQTIPSTEENAEEEVEFNAFQFMKTLPPYEDIVTTPRIPAIPPKSLESSNICLVLDLDETLVHCSIEQMDNPDLQFPVTFNEEEYIVNVKKRPYMEYFLKQVALNFEVIVFTASHQAYAETLLNILDPDQKLIKYRLYRDSCLEVHGNYLKDLNVLGRHLSKVVLVDNSPHAFGYQVNNGIPIETWFDDENDMELLHLLPFLENLHDKDDVRPYVRDHFQIQKLIDASFEIS